MPNYPQYTPYVGDPYSYGVAGGEWNYFPPATTAPVTPPGPGPTPPSAPSNEGASGSAASSPDIQDQEDVYRGEADVNIAYPGAPPDISSMTYDEYMQWVNSPPNGGRSLQDWLGLSMAGVLPSNLGGRAGSAVAGLAGSALAGTGGGLAASGIYDAFALRNQANALGNQGFTPQLNFWDYLMAALPFVSPESRIRDSTWGFTPQDTPDFSSESGVSEEGAALHGSSLPWGAGETPIETAELPPPEVGGQSVPINPSFNAEDVWNQMGPGVPTTYPIESEPLPPPPGFEPAPIPTVEPSYESLPPQDFTAPTPQIPYSTDISYTTPLSHTSNPWEWHPNEQIIYPEGNTWREPPFTTSDSQAIETPDPEQEEQRPSDYEEQWSTAEDVWENYDPGETYGEYARGGIVSAFTKGGAAQYPSREQQHKKRENEKRRRGLTRRLDEHFRPNETELGVPSSVIEEIQRIFDLEKFGPQGPYSSKMGSTFPKEFGFKTEEMDEFGNPIYEAPELDWFEGENFQGGGMVQGPGSGMDDMIPATIEGRQMAKLSNDEFVIPADVVSDLGDGSSNAGHKKLYQFISDIRQAKTGNSQQPPKLMSALRGLNENARGIKPTTFISDVIKMKQAINPGGDDQSYAAEYIRAIKSVMDAR